MIWSVISLAIIALAIGVLTCPKGFHYPYTSAYERKLSQDIGGKA